VSESVDVVVHCARVGGVPRVTEILAVEDLQTGPDSSAFTVTDIFGRAQADGSLEWTGTLPVRAARAFAGAGIDVRACLERGTRPAGRRAS